MSKVNEEDKNCSRVLFVVSIVVWVFKDFLYRVFVVDVDDILELLSFFSLFFMLFFFIIVYIGLVVVIKVYNVI